ncbi:MAG: hypothetical protein AAF412_15120 [Pseudomonadota bacterium]
MNEQQAFALMMDALDGVLDDSESTKLNQYLSNHPDLANEWEALQSVDLLLRASPPVAAPVNFTERTLARLPNPRARRIFMAFFFLMLLLGSILPIAFGIYTYSEGGFSDISANLAGTFQVLRVLFVGMTSAIQSLVVTQPVVYAWLATMLLSILVWAQTYRSAMAQVVPVPVRI